MTRRVHSYGPIASLPIALTLICLWTVSATHTDAQPLPAAPSCSVLKAREALPQVPTIVLSFREVKSYGPAVVAKRIEERQNMWRQLRTQIVEDPSALVAMYEGIRSKAPAGGYYRALGVREVMEILQDGRMQLGQYFSFKDEPPRVGHNNNFIFVRCRNCPDAWFRDGSTGSGVVNTHPIAAKDLEVVIP